MLLKCTDCSHDVNVEAKSCPNCGAPKPFKKQVLTQEQVKGMSFGEMSKFQKLGGKIEMGIIQKVLWGILALIIIIGIFVPESPKTPENIAAEAQENIVAQEHARNSALEFECRYAIKQSLNDPDSAEFDAVVVMPAKDDTYIVIQDLRAKNAFGGLVKGSYQCTESYNGASASIIDIKQLGI